MVRFNRQSQLIIGVFLGCAVLLGSFTLPVSVQADRFQTQDSPIQPLTLKPGESLERELKGGETHRYSLQLKANDYLKLVVEQKGIDVVVRLISPDGTKLLEVDSPNGTQGPEPVSFIPKTESEYLLEISALEISAQPGQYKVNLENLRTATIQEAAQFEIENLCDQVEQYRIKGKYNAALPLALKALEGSEKNFGPEHLLIARCLNNLALVYDNIGDYSKTEQFYLRSLAIREKILGLDHPDVATSLNNLAWLYQAKGDYVRAEPLYLRSLTIREKALGTNHPEFAQSCNNLAKLYYDKGEYDKAEPVFLQALTIRNKILTPNHPTIGNTLNNLGLLYQAKGEYFKAEPYFLRALAIYENSFGHDHQRVATCLNNLALLYQAKGEYSKAILFSLRDLNISEKVLGTNHPDVAITLTSLASIYQGHGDYTKAEPLYLRSLSIYEKVLGPNHPNLAQCLNNLASLYRDKGDDSRAEPLLLRGLAIREKTLGKDHPDIAGSLNNLARLYKAKGDFSKAESLYFRALDIQEKKLGMDHPDVATSLNNLANLYQAKGDFSKAEPLYLRSLVISEKFLGQDHPDFATSLNNIASLYQIKGDYSKAESIYQQSLTINEKALGSKHPVVASGFDNLARLYHSSNNILQSVALQSRCNELTELDLNQNLASGSEYQKLQYLDTTSIRTDSTISLHIQSAPDNQEALQTAFKVVLRRKGRALEAMTSSIEVLRKQSDAETQKLLDDYSSLVSQISVLTLRGPGKQKPEDHLAYLAELNTQKEKLEGDISRRSTQFQAQITPITLEGVQNAIPANAVLVEYASYRPYDPKTRKFGTPRFVAYTLENTGQPKFADLGEAEPIEQDSFELRKLIRASGGVRGVIPVDEAGEKKSVDEQIQAVSQRLYQRVVKPVRELVGTTRHLLISPDGGLNLVPFAALQDETGKYLVEQYSLTFLTSGRDLLRLKVKIPSTDPAFVLADPTYGEGNGPVLLGKHIGKLRELEGTKDEGNFLKRLFPKAQVLMGDKATKDTLKTVGKPALLHIATHGFFLEDAPKEAPDGNDFQRGGTLGDNQPPVNVEKLRESNPLLRSCLFFAGANGTGKTEGDTGTMTALEATGLDLWGTKLVVLSACDTGLGDVKNGDGVYGLRRALVLAGSEAQMMSLWPVSDEGTKELMRQYYTRLKAGEGRSEALRQVQLHMLKSKQWNHPYFWASFIQSGEWANLNGKRK